MTSKQTVYVIYNVFKIKVKNDKGNTHLATNRSQRERDETEVLWSSVLVEAICLNICNQIVILLMSHAGRVSVFDDLVH